MLDSFGWASLDSAEEFDGLFLFYSGLIPLRLHPSPMWHLCFKPSPIQLYNWLQCYYPYSKTSTDARYSFLFHEISKPANNSASNRKTFHNSKFLKALWIPWKGKGSIQITFFFFFFGWMPLRHFGLRVRLPLVLSLYQRFSQHSPNGHLLRFRLASFQRSWTVLRLSPGFLPEHSTASRKA